MTQPNHTTGHAPHTSAGDDRTMKWVKAIVGIAVLTAVIVLVVNRLTTEDSLDDPTSMVAYFNGDAEITTDTKVLYHRATVGRVTDVVRAQTGVQLVIMPDGIPERQYAMTLMQNNAIRTAHVRVSYYVTSIWMNTANSGLYLAKSADGWIVERAWGERPTVDGVALVARTSDSVAYAGDTTDVEPMLLSDGDAIKLHGATVVWSNEQTLTTVRVDVGRGELREASGMADASDTVSFPGDGSRLTLSTTFGLANSTLTLEPTFRADAAVDSTVRRELVTVSDINLQLIASRLVAYATSSRKMHAPPTNRIERVIADANTIIDTATTATTTIANYLANSRMHRAAPSNRAEQLIADLNNIGTDTDQLIRRVESIRRNIDDGVTQVRTTTVPEVNRAIADVKGLLRNASILSARIDALLLTVQDTTLYRIEGSVVRLIDELRSTNRQIKSTMRSVEGVVQ
ncbi:MAG: hypothetical protein H7X80_07655 [bacterium]|nr:hypothetical protein [Candidatus Kapabacteria bacterium]